MEKHVVSFGEKQIEFMLNRKKVKSVILKVDPSMNIIVSAAGNVPLDFILNYVKEKGRWILKKLEYFEDAQAYETDKEFQSGESIKYLGKQYRLKVIQSDVEFVKYLQGYIYIYIKDTKDKIRKRTLFTKWLREKAVVCFNESVDRVYPLLKKYGVCKPGILVRALKARWGSCILDKNTLLLNFDLIKAPKYCIDYVVLHELIHFKYHNHDKDFYNFLTSLMPDWRTRKEILDEEIVRDL